MLEGFITSSVASHALFQKSYKTQRYFKIENLQKEVNKQSLMEEKFNQDIEELSQETENLVDEIEKWQT